MPVAGRWVGAWTDYILYIVVYAYFIGAARKGVGRGGLGPNTYYKY